MCFFFSSRRRHTICGRDWSSDVCSSDLRFADGTITGDAQVTGCGHTTGGGGFAGAEHADVDITSAHLVAAGPDDPNFGTPGAQVFYIDSNVVNGEPNVSDFLGDSGIPAEAGHYSFHPVAGVAFVIQVAFRPAK